LRLRFALGLGESGNFPAGLKGDRRVVSKTGGGHWRRAFFVAGTNVRRDHHPSDRAFHRVQMGMARSVSSSPVLSSLVWLALWLKIYRRPQEHPKVSAGELAFIKPRFVRRFGGVRAQ